MTDTPHAETAPENETAALEALNLEGADFELTVADVSPPPPQSEPDTPMDKVLALALGPAFDILAPAWGVTSDEVGMLAGAYAKVLEKYFPDLSLGPELAALAVTAMVFGPRMGRPRKAEDLEGGDGGDKPEHGQGE